MLFICRPHDNHNLQKHKGLPWLYIGEARGARSVKRVLNNERRIQVAEDMERVSNLVRENFVEYIGQLSLKQKDKLLWYSSPIASKTADQTTIFKQYVFQKIIEEFVQKQNSHDILLVTDSTELIYYASRIWRDQVKTSGHTCVFFSLADMFLRGRIRFIRHVLAWVVIRFIKSPDLEKYDVLLHSWIDDRTFKRVPDFSDPYFGGLGEFLEENHRSVGRMVPLLPNPKYWRPLCKHFHNIIFPLAYVRFIDFVKVFFCRFTVSLPDDGIAGIKDRRILDVLFCHEVLKEQCSRNFAEYLLWHLAFKGISEMIRQKVTLFYTFENQPWEKMLNMAFSDSRFRRVGYQHTTIPSNWLDYRVASCEKQPLPDIVLTAGKAWSDFLKNIYTTIPVRTGGALRFAHLFKQQKQIDKERHDIVLALPMFPDVAVDLQEQVLRSLKEGVFGADRVIIKPHPYLSREALLKTRFLSYSNCEVSDQDMDVLLEKCKLLITTCSSVVFEAVFLGIKSLNFYPEQFSMGAEHFIKDYLFMAYEQNFSQILKQALESPIRPNAELNRFFSPPSFNAFLECTR